MPGTTLASLSLSSPLTVTIPALALAVAFTRLWVNDSAAQAVTQLHALGMRPGRRYRLGGAWALVVTREPRNRLWAALAAGGWAIVLVSLRLASW